MKPIFICIFFTFLALMPVAAQDSYPLSDNLQTITSTNAAQLKPLAQLGSAEVRGITWSPDGQTLLAATSDGTYRYDLAALDDAEFFAGMQQVTYNAAGTYAISRGKLMDGASFEVINRQGNSYFTSGGTVLVTTESDSETPKITLADANNLVEFGSLPTSGNIVISEDRRRAAVSSGGEYMPDDPTHSWIPYHFELWDIPSSKLLVQKDYLLDHFFPPEFNGKWVLVGDKGELVSGTIDVWDAEKATIVTRINSGSVTSTPMISPDERFLLIVGSITSLVSLDSEQSYYRLSPESLLLGEGRTYKADFSADGILLAAEASDSVEIYDLSENVPRPFAEIEYSQLIAFRSQEHSLWIQNFDGVLSLWDVQETGVHLRFATPPPKFARQPAFSADGSFLLSADNRLFEIVTGEERYTFSPDSSPQMNTDWSHAAYWLDGVLTLVNLRDASEMILMTMANNLGTLSQINPYSELALFYDDGIERVYDMRTGELRHEMREAFYAYFNENGTRVVEVVDKERAGTTIWDVEGSTPEPLVIIDLPKQVIAISADGNLAVLINLPEPPALILTRSYIVELWDVDAGVQIGQKVVESSRLPRFTFSPDTQFLAISLDEETLFCTISLNASSCASVRFPDTSWLFPDKVIFSANSELIVIEIDMYGLDGANGRYLFVESLDQILTDDIIVNGYNDVIFSSASSVFSGNSAFLLTKDVYSTYFNPPAHFRLRDSEGQELFAFDGVNFAAFSPDSRLVATNDGEQLQLWDVDTLRTGTAEPLVSIPNENVRGLAFNADGTRLYVYEQWRVTVWGVAG